MSRNRFYSPLLLGVLSMVLLLSACKKDEDPEVFVPFLRIDEVTPTTLTQFEENIFVTLTYDDMDGDLGFAEPDSFAIEVQDSRLTSPDFYHLQPLSPPDQDLHIRGTITLELSAPFLLGNGSQEVFSYAIRMKDQAGNWSNTEVTPDITVNK